MKVVIIKYNAGNIRSVYFALKRLGVEALITDDIQQIRSADKIIFPGVGEARSTMEFLKGSGMSDWIPELKQDFLGICLGMQLMCTHSEEGMVDCLDVIPHKVVRFPSGTGLKVPHMGWNSLGSVKGRLFPPSLEGEYVYFVHSYYVEQGEYTSALSTYGIPFSAALEKDNFFATQFHPEKSGKVGSIILEQFLSL